MSVLDELRRLVEDDDGGTTYEDTWEALRKRVTILSEGAWEKRIQWELVERWLANFDGRSGLPCSTERLHALYVLAQFLYFGAREIRVLLRALYRDLFLLPLVQEVRDAHAGTRDLNLIRRETQAALSRTRFLGVGNPSESGVHLLYFFRQENGLSKQHFLDTAEIFERVVTPKGTERRLQYHSQVDRYIFLDDVCGSGDTVVRYSRNFLSEIRDLNPTVHLAYLSIFAAVKGMETVRRDSIFGKHAAAVYELDETYQSLSSKSRYFKAMPENISSEHVRKIALYYGGLLLPSDPSGFMDGELLFGFHHNTPDNTLPIIWMDESHGSPIAWTPAFRRYPKI